jgi:hypothetical protein
MPRTQLEIDTKDAFAVFWYDRREAGESIGRPALAWAPFVARLIEAGMLPEEAAQWKPPHHVAFGRVTARCGDDPMGWGYYRMEVAR